MPAKKIKKSRGMARDPKLASGQRKKKTGSKIPKNSARKNNSAIKKEIRKAIEQIPKMVMEEREGKEDGIQNKNNIKKMAINYAGHASPKKYLLFWFGTILTISVVFIMWFANIRAVFGNINKKTAGNEAVKIWDESADDLQKIIKETKIKKDDIKEAVKGNLWDESALVAAASNLDLIIKNISEMTSTTATTSAVLAETASTTTNTASSTEKLF